MKKSVFALFNFPPFRGGLGWGLPLLRRGLGGGLLLLSGFGTTAFAQGAEVCEGTGYTIADAVPASAGSEYRWTENGNVLAGTNAAAYNVPNNKKTGVYTYVRQSKSADCPDWQSSNEFTVTVFACSFTAGTETGATATFTDPRDGKPYKTVVMPDGRTWFAQNLNYTKDLTFNAYAYEANGKQSISEGNAASAIGSYWCPGVHLSTYSGDQNTCNVYGALYTWETTMMVDGKYADESKTSSAWDESWVSPYYYTLNAPLATIPNADKNNGRGGTNAKGGGRGICPMGWHIPTDMEWAVMLDKVDGDGNGTSFINQNTLGGAGVDACIKLRSSATYSCSETNNFPNGAWCDYGELNGTDEYGFSVVPAGFCFWTTEITIETPYFHARGQQSQIWSSTITDVAKTTQKYFVFSIDTVSMFASPRLIGSSVRCIKD